MDAMVILLGRRMESALKVQSILTENSNIIKTRLGINQELSRDDNASGFIFLELCGTENQIKKMCDGLNALEDVKAECIKIELPGCTCQG